jgi:hypothetical protein
VCVGSDTCYCDQFPDDEPVTMERLVDVLDAEEDNKSPGPPVKKEEDAQV